MEPFLPLQVAEALQALGNLALIITTPIMIYLTLKLVRMEMDISHHIKDDEEKHDELYKNVGIHYSRIHDIQMDVSVLKNNANKDGHVRGL